MSFKEKRMVAWSRTVAKDGEKWMEVRSFFGSRGNKTC